MPNMGGLELLEAISKHTPNVVTVIMTGFGTVETAIDAMKRGAYDYILKPFKVEEVVHTIRRGLEKQKLQAENMRLKEALSLYKVSEAIAASLSLDEVMRDRHRRGHRRGGRRPGHRAPRRRRGRLLRALRRAATRTFDAPGQARQPRAGEPSSKWFERGQAPARARHQGAGVLPSRRCRRRSRPQSLMVTQLRMRSRTIGFLGAVSYTRGKKFDEGQRKMLRHASPTAPRPPSRTRKLYEDLQGHLPADHPGLASAIDKMDRYTAGHSGAWRPMRRSSPSSSASRRRRSRSCARAALMHDIGKIGCVMNLNKPGKLSAGGVRDLQEAPGLRQGHPRADHLSCIRSSRACTCTTSAGTGAAIRSASRAQDIPLIARIISVADTYDAMTSDRAYRKALPHEVAVNEIRAAPATQFDPDMRQRVPRGDREAPRGAGRDGEEGRGLRRRARAPSARGRHSTSTSSV